MPWVEEQTDLSIKNILLATDSSEPSEAILPYAVGLARRYGSSIWLADAISPEAICEIVRNRQVDLVVVGAHGQKLRFNLGSTAEEIFRMLPCPVLIIGPKVTQTELAKRGLERIVYVTDFSTSSLDALPYALALAQDNEAQLTLVHVAEETTMGPFYYGDSRSVAFRKRLESLLPARSGFLCRSEFVIGDGDRVEGLLRITANLNASLIVMSARGIPAEASVRVLGLIAGQVVCRAHCPVLMVRG
jgi:nucleotide-binding universal stress UspA family protein